MRAKRIMAGMVCAILCFSLCSCGDKTADFSLWNSEGAITDVTDYVQNVTDEKSEDFIPEEDRIAVFDLDGTLVCEQFPIYFEWLMFAQRVSEIPELLEDSKMRETAQDILIAAKERSIPEDLEERESKLFGKAFEGMSTEEYRDYVTDFLSEEADSFDGITFGDAYFKPMTEIINYLEENNFKVYICSGTDRDADRVWVNSFTDIPDYQVIGSDYYTEGAGHKNVYYLNYQFDPKEKISRGGTRIIKNVKSSKVVQLSQELGQKPVLAFGNSSGDFSMFVYTTAKNEYTSAAFCILPDDNTREYANMKKVKTLQKICEKNGWHTISMRDDFLTIYGDDVKKDAEDTVYVDSLLKKLSSVEK